MFETVLYYGKWVLYGGTTLIVLVAFLAYVSLVFRIFLVENILRCFFAINYVRKWWRRRRGAHYQPIPGTKVVRRDMRDVQMIMLAKNMGSERESVYRVIPDTDEDIIHLDVQTLDSHTDYKNGIINAQFVFTSFGDEVEVEVTELLRPYFRISNTIPNALLRRIARDVIRNGSLSCTEFGWRLCLMSSKDVKEIVVQCTHSVLYDHTTGKIESIEL